MLTKCDEIFTLSAVKQTGAAREGKYGFWLKVMQPHRPEMAFQMFLCSWLKMSHNEILWQIQDWHLFIY